MGETPSVVGEVFLEGRVTMHVIMSSRPMQCLGYFLQTAATVIFLLCLLRVCLGAKEGRSGPSKYLKLIKL